MNMMRSIRRFRIAGLLVTVFCLYSCHQAAPVSDSPGSEETIQQLSKTNDMKELRKAITETLEEMAKKARSMDMQGVAVASVLPKESDVDWIGEMKVVDTPYNAEGGDKGWNLVAIAWSKAGEVIASGAERLSWSFLKIQTIFTYRLAIFLK